MIPPGGLLCFDLDGPLLNVEERYWRLHLHGAGIETGQAVAGQRDFFWRLKRRGAGDAEVCRSLASGREVEAYRLSLAAALELPEYLQFDRPWSWTIEVLSTLRTRYRIGLITMRRNRASLSAELDATELAPLLDGIASRADLPAGPGDHKVDLVESLERQLAERAVAVVGDSEIDVRTAQELGITAVAVTCGMCSDERLMRLQPDHVIGSIAELPALCGLVAG